MGMFSWSSIVSSRSSPSSTRANTKLFTPAVTYGSSTASSSTDSGPETDNELDEVDLGFSFSGGGWLMIYMYGVAKALQENGVHRNARFIGSSSGALTAMGLHLDAGFDEVANIAIDEYVPMARASVRGAFRMRDYVHLALLAVEGVERWPKTKSHPRTCQVVYTSLSSMTSRRKSTFESQDDLVNGLLASCTATPIAGFPFKYDGEWVMDGGVLDNQPLFREEDGVRRTVTITPNAFDASADIKPSKYIPPWWSLYPPPQEGLQWVFQLGYVDGHAWCERNGYTMQGQRSAITPELHCYAAQYETVFGQVTGYLFYEKFAKAFSRKGENSVYTLLRLELVIRMILEVVVASVNAVMVMWTAIVAAAFLLLHVVGPTDLWTTEKTIITAVYLSVCAVHVGRKAYEIKSTTTRQQIDSTIEDIQAIRSTSSGIEAHGVKALKAFHTQLQKNQHDVLVENSVLYRISTML